jgi:hypothetical protein
MPPIKWFRKIWHKTPTGLYTPGGTVSHLSQISSDSFLEIKNKALSLEKLFSESMVTVPASSDIARLINDAKELSDSWLTKRAENIPLTLLFSVVQFDRIADAVLPLFNVNDRSRYLKSLTSGRLNFLEREASYAKDIFWELELWSFLLKRGFNATLSEPDIIVEFEGAKVAIACKKIYSIKPTLKTLSNAVAQIEKAFDFGIAAINLDDILPAQQVLRTPTQHTMSEYLNRINTDFIAANDRHFRRYLAPGRLISALVSTGIIADLYKEKTKINNGRQSTIWTIPGLSSEKEKQLDRFYSQLMS